MAPVPLRSALQADQLHPATGLVINHVEGADAGEKSAPVLDEDEGKIRSEAET